jgi:hypothetical protein
VNHETWDGGNSRAARIPSPSAASGDGTDVVKPTPSQGVAPLHAALLLAARGVPPGWLHPAAFRSAKTATTLFLAGLGRGFATFVLTETNQTAMKNPRSLPVLSKAVRRLAAGFGVWLAVAVMGIAGQEAQAAAVIAADVAASDALGDAPGNLWVTATVNYNGSDIAYNFTAFPIGKQVDIQGNTIKTFLYTPEHALVFTYGQGTITGIGDGTNFISNRGHELQNIQIEYRGGYDPVIRWNENKDVVILSTTTSLPDSYFFPLAPAGTTSSNINQIVTSTGFGRLRVDGVLQPQTGNSYGFRGILDSALTGAFNHDGSYKSLYYSPNYIPVGGIGEQGDSGSRVTNANGNIIGAIVAVYSFAPYDFGYTFMVDFTTPAYRSQVTPYWGVHVISVPFPLIINAQTNFGFASQQFRFTLTGPAGSNAVIAASTNLQTWSPLYTNTLVGGSLNFTDTLATNYLRRFYRASLK